jgi:hypothetical protein
MPSPADAPPIGYAWGQPEKGLRIGVAKITAATYSPSPFDLLIAIENVSKDDVVLNLGLLIANGKQQYPNALSLFLTDPDGYVQKLPLGPVTMGGTIGPFVVPLSSGATYTLRCGLGSFAPAPSGPYRLAVGFEGKTIAKQKAYVGGQLLMPCWTGTLWSGEIPVTVPEESLYAR